MALDAGKLESALKSALKSALDSAQGPAPEEGDGHRQNFCNAVAQAVAALGVQIDVNQAITRTSGAVRNPNLELLFKGPTLRNFNFTIRFTPRDAVESKRVRMIIRVLKQHSAVKKNARVFNDSATSNFLIGTPDVFKLRYIKARTQRDIKGLNKLHSCFLSRAAYPQFLAYEEIIKPNLPLLSLDLSSFF